MTALLIFGIIALILMTAFGVAITVLVSRALSRAFSTLDSVHERNAKHVDGLLDRLTTIRWEDYVSLRSMDNADDTGFFAPGESDDEDEEPVKPQRWGALTTARERMDLTDDERAILEEDFPEEREA